MVVRELFDRIGVNAETKVSQLIDIALSQAERMFAQGEAALEKALKGSVLIELGVKSGQVENVAVEFGSDVHRLPEASDASEEQTVAAGIETSIQNAIDQKLDQNVRALTRRFDVFYDELLLKLNPLIELAKGITEQISGFQKMVANLVGKVEAIDIVPTIENEIRRVAASTPQFLEEEIKSNVLAGFSQLSKILNDEFESTVDTAREMLLDKINVPINKTIRAIGFDEVPDPVSAVGELVPLLEKAAGNPLRKLVDQVPELGSFKPIQDAANLQSILAPVAPKIDEILNSKIDINEIGANALRAIDREIERRIRQMLADAVAAFTPIEGVG